MTSIKNTIAAITLSLGLIGTAHAHEQTIKPLQGVSFHAGSKHAVAYFFAESDSCRLVVTAIDDADLAPARRETAIAPGKSLTYQLAEGHGIEFACRAQAKAIDVKSLQTVAAP